MNMHFVFVLVTFLTTCAPPPRCRTSPALPWQERSDWINVKTDVAPPAVGDGVADDTAAIQAALDLGRQSRPSTCRRAPTGSPRRSSSRDRRSAAWWSAMAAGTRLVWDGPQGGRMFWSNGVAYSRYVGLSWDGRGKAAVGFDHAAQQRFETEVRHEHEAFRNFTEHGIRVGHQQKVASAEILYRNCLFENCGTALAFLTFNDYDNTIDGCEFRDCGTGVLDNKGNFYARNCHFEGSRRADFVVGSEHGSSIRRSTSIRFPAIHRGGGDNRTADDPGLPRRRLDRSGGSRAPRRQPRADVRLLVRPAAFQSAAGQAGKPGTKALAQQQPAGQRFESLVQTAPGGKALHGPARPTVWRDKFGRTAVPARLGPRVGRGLRRGGGIRRPRETGRPTTPRRSRPPSTRRSAGRGALPTFRPAATWCPRRFH